MREPGQFMATNHDKLDDIICESTGVPSSEGYSSNYSDTTDKEILQNHHIAIGIGI